MSKFLVALQQLERWFQRQKRSLPWRDNPSPYRVWISEIMLQQTQVITVIPYFERFVDRFPTVESLAQAPEEDVLRHWAGLGYYSRARNLHRGAQRIVQQGRFPADRAEWLEIPGVGPYTAGAILSIALDQPESILDGNVERVLSRVRRCDRQQGDSAFRSRLWKLSHIFVKSAYAHGIRPSVLNQALMELGATHCNPRNPRCDLCPLQNLCRAHQAGDPQAYPPKKKAKKWIQVHETLHCVLNTSHQVLLRQRQPGEWRAGLWDLLEEPPQKPSTSQPIGTVETQHVVTHHKIKRKTLIWKAPKKSVVLSNQMKWVSAQNPEVAVGSALKKTLNQIYLNYNLSL